MPSTNGPDLSNQKLDTGKSPIWRGLVNYFPRALAAVGEVSAYGNKKYGEWGGWVKVDNAEGRYLDALVRHLVAQSSEGEFDSESGLLHQAQVAWNALAVLELDLREREERNIPNGQS